MPLRVRLPLALVALVALATGAARAQAPGPSPAPGVEVEAEVRLDLEESTLDVRATVRVRNDGPGPLVTLPLVLYPNRFREVDPAITDVTFDRYYAPWFDAGALHLEAATDAAGRPLALLPPPQDGRPEGTSLEVVLPRPVPPGAWAEVRLASRLEVPSRLGSFGRRGRRVVLEGGWMPMVPALDTRTGRRDPRGPPALGRHALRVVVLGGDPDIHVVVAGRRADEGPAGAPVEVVAPTPSLAVGADLEVLARVGAIGEAPGVTVLGRQGDEARAERILLLATAVGRFLRVGPGAGLPPGDVTFVRAPLRDRFVLPTADGQVLYSDRLFDVVLPLQSFHEAEVARATLEALVRQGLRARDPGADRDWLAEALAWVLSQDWLVARRGGLAGSTVRRGLSLLDFIPAIDALVRAPRFVGSDVYYGRFHEPQDAVPDELSRALSRRPRGRVVAEKLRDLLGDERLRAIVSRALAAPAGLPLAARPLVADVAGRRLDGVIDLWTDGVRPPRQNLVIEDVQVGGPVGPGDGGDERVRVTIRRDGDPRPGEVGEPVVVETTGSDGAPRRAVWDGLGQRGVVDTTRARRLLWSPIVLDPELRVDETDRGDDEDPRLAKLLVNRASVHLDLNHGNKNEASVGVSIIPGYDYAHVITLDASYQQEERGVTVGYARGLGWSIDERRFGVSVGGSVTADDLAPGALRPEAGVVESEGTLLSVGAGLSFDTRLTSANPRWGVGAGVGVEHADKVLGTRFRFDVLSLRLTGVASIVRGTQLGVEVLLGQVVGTDVPSQRLFDVGGEGAVRGVRTGLFVDRAYFAVRGELRQMLVEDLNVPLLWLAWLRKVQLAVFIDTGNVGRTIDEVVARPQTDWKWGTGAGARVFLDIFGVQPIVVRFDLGFRIDETLDLGPQYYVGAGQAF